MALESYTCERLCINFLADFTRKQDEFAGQGQVRRSNVKSNKATSKALTLLRAPTLPLISLLTNDLFTQFIKIFLENTQT